MDQILLIFFIFICLSIPNFYAQQNYSGNSVTKCDNNDETGPSPAFLYTCNGRKQSCQAFLIFKSQPPYDTVSSISNLTSSDPSEVANINNITNSAEVLPPDKEVIVPVICSCSGQYYQANTSFTIPSNDDTYFTIAYNTYQGLTSCDILPRENNYSATILNPGLILQIPLRCACPTSNQAVNGTKFLLTYPVSLGDYVYDISERFYVSIRSVVYANGFTENVLDGQVLFPFTTILIPLSTEPSSSQTIVRYPPPPYSSPIIPLYKNNKRSSNRLYVWTGIGISLLVICFVLSIVLLHYKKKRNEVTQKIGKGKEDLPEEFLLRIANIDQGLKFYKYEEINAATENFSTKNMIGSSVYCGILDGKMVAIKIMIKNVCKEVNLLKKINHFNIISLYGACAHHGVFYLVYEFMENGSLKDLLHKKNAPEVESWNCRIQIAVDVAHGLLYLHNFTDTGYVHKDISSGNVLLDKHLRAKIANFSLARSAVRGESGNVSTKTALGTKGYMAPEYIEYGLVTPEMDTFSFGVVLIELVTGKEAVFKQDGEEALLAEAVFSAMEGGNAEANLGCLIEPNLQAKNKMEFALRIIKLSLACLSQEPESRPSMADVVSSLLKIQLDVQRSEPFFWNGFV
ncbi:hypothetical protein Ddye_010364 [Dipteronia dyeriana]|uniref:Uncharacterized protein n=1 Tax=Dipteronia dyeriana TaxID=168575 RepID=A0AAE0CN64_9ROSI|nr:hypothetical protein Ddye_010364 [Dipteronia dyeriana]